MLRNPLLPILVLILLTTLTIPASPADITVTGGCSLIDAITAANNDTATGGCTAGAGADTIMLDHDVTLTAVEEVWKEVFDTYDFGASGLPVIRTPITIEGGDYSILRQSDSPQFRVFSVAGGGYGSGMLTLRNVTVAGGFLDGGGRILLPEPQSLLTVSSKMPGTDGQKMSKSYGNTIALREEPDVVAKKIKTMPTDPARVRRNDPGDPEKCPVWKLHQVYSSEQIKATVVEGCKTASIGCIDCKQYISDAIIEELRPIQHRVKDYLDDLSGVDSIINEGCEAARDVAQDTIEEVRKVMGLTTR